MALSRGDCSRAVPRIYLWLAIHIRRCEALFALQVKFPRRRFFTNIMILACLWLVVLNCFVQWYKHSQYLFPDKTIAEIRTAQAEAAV